VPLETLTVKFISDFEYYLKTADSLAQNTASKYLKILKKVIRCGVMNEWLKHDPFSTYRCKTDHVDRGFLSRLELKKIEDAVFSTKRLEEVRDVFVFCCYTGLSYCDVVRLTQDQITKGENGFEFIHAKRRKTGTESIIPILPRARAILDKYSSCPACTTLGKLLPVKSNQKMNEYLAEVATISGVSKKITCHLARHTFATTLTLENGISLESVSKMLGHTSQRTTQIYARMTERRIAEEITKIKDKI
jgi:site-specific recombinase XerD